jgi:uncharacterized protein YbjT (DUF2867 family)
MKRLILLLLLLSLTPAGKAIAAENILVLGGTGRLGSEVVRAALANGHAVSVYAREGASRARLADAKVKYVAGDLGSTSQLDAAMRSVRPTVVIDASGRRTDDQSYSHAITMPVIVEAARHTGTRQIIFISSVGAGENLKKFQHIPWGEYLPLLEERGIAERVLMSSGIPFTVIRTGNVPDPAIPATGAAYLTEDQSVFGVSTRPDLAKLTAECIGASKCRNKVFHVADRKLKPPL